MHVPVLLPELLARCKLPVAPATLAEVEHRDKIAEAEKARKRLPETKKLRLKNKM